MTGGREPGPPGGWDGEAELARDRRVERALVWKEAGVIALLAVFVVVRVLLVG